MNLYCGGGEVSGFFGGGGGVVIVTVNISSSQVELDGLVTSSLAHRYQNVFDAYFNVVAMSFLSLL